jgi:serine protease Do
MGGARTAAERYVWRHAQPAGKRFALQRTRHCALRAQLEDTMRMRLGVTFLARISSYTPGVTRRRLVSGAGGAALLVAALAASHSALAQDQGDSTAVDVAQEAGQIAHALGDAAEQYADQNLDPPEAKPEDPLERARQGVVLLERRGKPIAVGSVLQGDGRIVTALSPLGHGNNVDARFADGSVMQVRVGHVDRGWDLALLVPQNGRWTKGLRASRVSPTAAGASLRTFSVVRNKQLAPSRTIVKGKRTLVGGDSELLRDGLELASRLRPTDLGSPVVDDQGNVVAVIAQACAPSKESACTMVPFGVPVAALKAFLRTVPANAVPPAPWLGIQGAAEDTGTVRGVRVLSVHPQSPAAAAGLKGGPQRQTSDIVVAVDGAPVTSPEQLAATVNRRSVGDTIQVLLFGEGKYRQVTVALRAAPGTKASPAPGSGARKARVGPEGPKPRRQGRSKRPAPVGY